MKRGKQTCKILKEIRQQIAQQNDIELITEECNFRGDCSGTCPKCEAEVRYLETELEKRRSMGKVAVVAGLSVGLLAGFSNCQTTNKTQNSDNAQNKETSGNECLEPPLAGIIARDVEKDSMIYIEREQKTLLPEYEGGEEALLQFVADNLVFSSYLDNAKGSIELSFTVETDGTLSNIKVLKGIDEKFDQDVISIFYLMKNWKPAVLIQGNDSLPISYDYRYELLFPIQPK